MYNIEKIKNDIKNNLSEFRYEHSLLVATCALSLARHYNLDEDKAYVAGLIHDIAKEYTDEENNNYLKKYSINSKLLNPKYRPVIHAEIGALVAKCEYNMEDDICQAIRYHALGNINMNLFDKIIFIADKIGRKQSTPSIEKIKNLAYKNIDQAILYYLKDKKKKFDMEKRCFLDESLELLVYLSKNK